MVQRQFINLDRYYLTVGGFFPNNFLGFRLLSPRFKIRLIASHTFMYFSCLIFGFKAEFGFPQNFPENPNNTCLNTVFKISSENLGLKLDHEIFV
jgi:hypothetical protein